MKVADTDTDTDTETGTGTETGVDSEAVSMVKAEVEVEALAEALAFARWALNFFNACLSYYLVELEVQYTEDHRFISFSFFLNSLYF